MKKRVVPSIGLSLLMALALLFWVQYSYYTSVMSMSQEQTKQLAKEALSQVAQDLELRELVRYLNRETQLPTRSFSNWYEKNQGASQFYLFDNDIDLDSIRSLIRHAHPGINAEQQVLQELEAENVLTEEFLINYLNQRKQLDVLMLRYLYNGQRDYDSIPRLVSPRFLQQQIRRHFDEKGICEPYYFTLHEPQGKMLYEYLPAGMLRSDFNQASVVTQRLFVRNEAPNAFTPFIRLHLNLRTGREEVLKMVLPGMISTIIVVIAAIFSIVLLIKQVSFQRTKNSFINNMTHEFKTPVSSINLATQMLKEETKRCEGSTRQRQLVSIIDMEIRRLKLLIEKVLNFSILEGKPGKMPLKTIDLNEILLSCAEVYTLHAQRDGGDLKLNLEADNTWVKGNTVHLTNAFFNLLDNASKYRSKEHPLELSISTRSDQEYIYVQIQDNGIGIPKESLKKIFDRYYRVPTGHVHDVKGFGLGLAYVSSVIKSLEGSIHAEPVSTGGTRMCIKLPLTREV